MLVMLDTNICIYLIKQRSDSLEQKIREFDEGDIVVSAITAAELQFGVANSQKEEQNQAALNRFFTSLQIIDFDYQAAVTYGQIRTYLRQQGPPIGGMDLLIAAHAPSQSLTLITNNLREFQHVPSLRVENWI